MSLTDVLGFFLHSSHNVLSSTAVVDLFGHVVAHCQCFPFFLYIVSCCTSYPQCLCNGFPLCSKLSNSLLFSKDSSLVFILVYPFLTQMQSSQAKPKAKTKSKLSELFIV